MGFSESVSEGAPTRVSPQSLGDQGEPYGLALADGNVTGTASISDWLPDFLKGTATDKGKCQPSPLYDDALSLAKQLYYDQSKTAQLSDYQSKFNCQIKGDDDAVNFANQALHTIGDPYTRVMSKAQADEMRTAIQGDSQISGIGINIGLQKNERTGDSSYAIVGGVFPGTPAERAGLKPGDIILQIGDQSTKDLPMEKIQSLVRGDTGSKVQFKIDRDGKMMDIYATRASIEVPATIEKNFGDVEYVRLIDFMNDKTDTSLQSAISQHPNAKAFIVDVRGNPGGRVEEMLQTVGLLMKDGKLFTEQTRTEDGVENASIELNGNGIKTVKSGALISPVANRDRYMLNGRPLVLLVDEYSASASELLAGALKDNGAATLVGARTFGKGVGQVVVPIEDGAMVAVTNTRYTNPGGNWSGDGNQNRIGIEPNITVANDKGALPLSQSDKQFQTALAEARHLAGLGPEVSVPKASVPNPSVPKAIQSPAPLTPWMPSFAPTVPFFQRLKELQDLENGSQPVQTNLPGQIYQPSRTDQDNSPAQRVRKPYGP